MSVQPDGGIPDFILVMGVSGAGKSTVATALAQALDGVFVEGDSLHPAANIAAMSAGRPLTDALRLPWLEAICVAAREERDATGRPVVIACSALKRRYRDLLRDGLSGLVFVHLDGSADVIQSRLAARTDHFMPASLLATQIADLEQPDADEGVIRVDISAPAAEVLASVTARLTPTIAKAREGRA
jgi:carbohydrate kinase (thermoresistant glucokinase family)